MATITVLDSAGATQTVAKVVNTGSAAATDSLPVAAATEDIARVGTITETAPATDTASSGLNGRLQRIAQRLTSLIALLPASLGSKADAASLAVTQSTEDKAVQTAISAVAGTTSGAAVTTDATGTLQQYLRGIITKMVAQLPASLGSKADTASLAVTQSTEDKAVQTALAAVLGTTSGAAVTTDANGTIQQYLRGLIAKTISGIVVSGSTNMAAAATGGYTPFSLRSAATNNATSVKASAGTLGYLNAVNTTATLYYLKLYNKASSPAPGSDNALLVGVYPVPASTTGAGIAIPLPPQGMNFSTGIAYALVAGLSDTDNTSAATGVCVNGGYA